MFVLNQIHIMQFVCLELIYYTAKNVFDALPIFRKYRANTILHTYINANS